MKFILPNARWAQAVGHRCLTAEARFRFIVSPYEIFVAQIGTGTSFPAVLQFSPSVSFHHFYIMIIHSSLYQSEGQAVKGWKFRNVILCRSSAYRNVLSFQISRFCLANVTRVEQQHSHLNLQPSGHYMYRTVVAICTTSLTLHNSTFCPHSVFMCFVWI